MIKTAILLPWLLLLAVCAAPAQDVPDMYAADEVQLIDGEPYTNTEMRDVARISYTRNFKSTKWQAWYVPFEVDYDALSSRFTMARINNIREYDDNDDGTLDRWTAAVVRLRPGSTVYANTPYLVRAHS